MTFDDKFREYATKLAEIQERVLEAWLASTGVNPRDAELVQERTKYGWRTYVRRKIDVEPERLVGSIDARDWANEFSKQFGVAANLVETWFANSLMAGYDEGFRRSMCQNKVEELKQVAAAAKAINCRSSWGCEMEGFEELEAALEKLK